MLKPRYMGKIGELGLYEIRDTHGYPKVRIREIEDPLERDICLLYWAEGLTQQEVAKKCGVSQPYVNQVIKRYKRR